MNNHRQLWNHFCTTHSISTNKVSLFETQAVTYDRLQESLIAQNQIETALVVSQQKDDGL